MNSSYQGQNINYKNSINNTININSPNNNNLYYNFKADKNIISKSPDIKNLNNHFRYFSNNKSSKYQSFYKNLSIQIPSKIILISSNTSRNFPLSSSKVYSKPKLPRCRINKGKNMENSEKIGHYYLTIQNDGNNEKIKNKILLNNSSQKKIPKVSKDIIISLKNKGKKNKPTIHTSYAEDIFNINSINTFKKIIDNNINENEIIKENENNKVKEYLEEHPIKIFSGNLIDVKIEGNNNEITYDDKNTKRNNENNKGEIDKINNLKNKNQKQNNNPIIIKRKDCDSKLINNEAKKELEADHNKEKDENENKKIYEEKMNKKKDNMKKNCNKEDKKKLRRNKKIIKIEEDERKKMEIEENIKKEEIKKLKKEEEERKKRLKRKYTKKEKLKIILEERISMEKEEEKAQKKKKIEDKIIKEEDEEDELEEDEKQKNENKKENEDGLIF